MSKQEYVLQERLYVTMDGARIAEEGEPRRLLGNVGQAIPIADAERLGLVAEPKGKKATDDKAKSPKEDKGEKPADAAPPPEE